ncbi:MAG: hypothetical protein LBQ03_02580 [Puniceicoccales bacterium]|nr:hypothetical protein [Puniceicoccales bacterium]
MKNSIKKIFFGVVLLGTYHLYGTSEVSKSDEFKSLRERSPFGDTPKPEPKPQPQPQQSAPKAPIAAPPPVPQKPDMKLGLTGHMKMNGQDYFSICDKTSKDEIHTILVSGKSSPLGYVPGKFDTNKQTLEIKINGYGYTCHIGEEEKKTNNSTATYSNPNSSANNSNPPAQNISTSSSYNDYNNWNWDDWDDWDDDW